MTSYAACTIISKNYLSQARAFSQSYLDHHPKSRVYVLLVDELEGYFDPKKEPFTLISIGEIGIPNITSFCFKYSILELNTAVKPFFLETLFKQFRLEKLLYFDPDIFIYTRLHPLLKLLDTSAIVLTPHITMPIDDDRIPNEIDILVSGAYNLGFIALSKQKETKRFLSWWKSRLKNLCLKRVDVGLYVDQKWIDLVPSMYRRVSILTHPGYNVAYWNLQERNIKMNKKTITVNNKPLYFFHFSGFEPERFAQVSKHQTRFTMRDLKKIQPLFTAYKNILIKYGYNKSKHWPYAFGRYENGQKISTEERRNYYSYQNKKNFGDPFKTNIHYSYYHYFHSRRRFAKKILQIIGDASTQLYYSDFLQKRKYLVKRLLGDRIVTRVRNGVKNSFRDTVSRSWRDDQGSYYTERAVRAQIPSYGLNISGHIQTESGVGEAVRSTIRAIGTTDIPYALNNFQVNVHRKGDTHYKDFSSHNPYAINCVHVNADQVRVFQKKVGRAYFDKRYTIGYWHWETSNFPEDFKPALETLDEIWTPSVFSLDTLSKVASIPVVRMPLCLSFQRSKETDLSKYLPDKRRFMVLFIFDFLSIFERKNPLGVVHAFRKAFPNTSQAQLIIKCVNGEKYPEKLKQLQEQCKQSNIFLLHAYLSSDEVRTLVNCCNCYISLHRSEGFGLTIAEAMACGKPVIATGYSGNMDFMNANNSLPVSYNLIRLTSTLYPYKRGDMWADPDIDEAAHFLRHLYNNPQKAQSIGRKAKYDLQTMLNPKIIGQRMKERLQHIISTKQSIRVL